MAYWDDEKPQVFRVGGMELRYYEKAAKLQVYQQDPTRAHGVSKGVVIELAKAEPKELAGLLVAFDHIFYDHVSEEITQDQWQEFLTEHSEVING